MRKHYTPASSLHATYVGPMRVMEIHEQGALLKDPRTGETMSVHFSNIRKINIDEFLTLLPSNFDAEIINDLKLNRYNRQESPENCQLASNEPLDDNLYNPDNPPIIPNAENHRKLRSGKLIKLNDISIPLAVDKTILIYLGCLNNFITQTQIIAKNRFSNLTSTRNQRHLLM